MIDQVIKSFDKFGMIPHTLPNAVSLWPNEQKCLIWCALNSPNNANWIEIGSFCGGSAVLLCLAKQLLYLNNVENSSKVYSVDIKFNRFFDHNIYTIGKFDKIHRKIEVDSSHLSKYIKNEIFGFVFIDGFHSFRQVITDFEQICPFLHDDAIISFHDVSPFYIPTSITQNIFDMLWASGYEDFYIDHAISWICQKYNYELIDIPVKNMKETYFEETKLKEWVRGQTSPFNAFCAIRRKR